MPQRPFAEIRSRGRADDVAQERGGTAQALELVHATRTAGEVAGGSDGGWRVAGHQPVQPAVLGRGELQLLEDFFVIHGSV
jgi:hypothetical protein